MRALRQWQSWDGKPWYRRVIVQVLPRWRQLCRQDTLTDKHLANLDVLFSDVVLCFCGAAFSQLLFLVCLCFQRTKNHERLTLCCSLRDRHMNTIKCVVVGDKSVGKTAFCLTYTTGSPPKCVFFFFLACDHPSITFLIIVCSLYPTEDTSQPSLTITLRMLWLMANPSILASGTPQVMKSTNVCAPFRTHRQTSSFFCFSLAQPTTCLFSHSNASLDIAHSSPCCAQWTVSPKCGIQR